MNDGRGKRDDGLHQILKFAFQKEMTKNPVFMQKKLDTDVMNDVAAVLTAVVDATAFSSAGGAGAEQSDK